MRNVYLDPFGAYTNAFDKGLSRQMEVEANRRNARQADFNYNYMTPIDYSNAKIANDFAQFNLPYLKDNAVYATRNNRNAAFASDLGTAGTFAGLTGVVHPLAGLGSYFGYNIGKDDQGNITYTDPYGNLQGSTTPESLLGYANYDKTLAQQTRADTLAQSNFENQYKLAELYRQLQALQTQLGVAGIYGNRGAGGAADNFGAF